MFGKRTFTVAALVAAFLFLAVLPAQAECSTEDCRLSPLQSRQVNPNAVTADGEPGAVEGASLSPAQAGDMPLVTAGQLEAATNHSPVPADRSTVVSDVRPGSEHRATSSELSAPRSVPHADAPSSVASLDLRMRYQPFDPTDISCGVQALGMALDGLDGAAPTSAALTDFLEDSGLLYEWGTGVEELAFAAARFGYGSAQPFHGWSVDQLQSELAAGRPVVVSLGANGEGVPGHFVTVTGVSPDGQWVSYNDPILGAQTVHRAVFAALWDLQGRSGVSFAAAGAGEDGEASPQQMAWLAFAAGLMAVISQSPLYRRRKGIGGRLVNNAGSTAAASRPPYPAPAGKRWKARIMPRYETRTVQAGWKTIRERVPITKQVRYQAGTRTVHQRVPKYRTVRVRQGHRRVPKRVPVYRSRRYVRYYRTSWRRVGWRWVRRRVPVYGSRRVRAGTRTVWRTVPRYVTKRVFDGYRTVAREVPVYKTKEVVIGYRFEDKRVPRMVEKKVQVGTKVEWELVESPQRTWSSSASQGASAKLMPPSDSGPADAGGGDKPRRPSIISREIWDALNHLQREKTIAGLRAGTSIPEVRPSGMSNLVWNVLTGDLHTSLEEADSASEEDGIVSPERPEPISPQVWKSLSGEQRRELLKYSHLFTYLEDSQAQEHAVLEGTFIGNNPYSVDDSYGPSASIKGIFMWLLALIGLANTGLEKGSYGRYLNTQPVNVTGQLSYSTSTNGTILKSLIIDNHSGGPLKATVDITTSQGRTAQLETRWLEIGANEFPVPNFNPDEIGNLSPYESASVTVSLYAAYNDPPIFRFLTYDVQPECVACD